MKLEKREVTLNEKDSILDMIFFEESLQRLYEKCAQENDCREMRCIAAEYAKEVDGKLEELKGLLKKPSKM